MGGWGGRAGAAGGAQNEQQKRSSTTNRKPRIPRVRPAASVAMYRAYLAAQKRAPYLVSIATGSAVMSAGDLGMQCTVSERETVDMRQNVVSSVYMGLTSPVMLAWWVYLDRVLPGIALAQLARKVRHHPQPQGAPALCGPVAHVPGLPSDHTDGRTPQLTLRPRRSAQVIVNQIVVSNLNLPCYLAWCNHVEAWLDGRAGDWAAVRAATLEQGARELPRMLANSFAIWLPINTINFVWVPVHLKIPYTSAISVLWGGYMSYVAHRAEHERPRGAAQQVVDSCG